MKRLKIHILYEYGNNFRPHASSSLRLLRPLTHPKIQDKISVTSGHNLGSGHPDFVFIDRLWKPEIQPEMVYAIADKVKQLGARLIYWFDDHLLALDGKRRLPDALRDSFKAFLDVGDGFVVSTQPLSQAFSDLPEVHYLRSALDERIIIRKFIEQKSARKITIGYMGTSTHDEDLQIVIPALRAICLKYPGKIRLEFVGVMDDAKLNDWDALKELPVRILRPLPSENEYPLFMTWFTSSVNWDIGIAPLENSYFNSFKSDIKFLDYTAADIPGLYSNVPAYAGTVEHKKTGFLVDNNTGAWVTALEDVMSDNQMRLEMLKNASTYLYGDRTLAACATSWLQLLESLST